LTRAPENTANISAIYELPTDIGDFDFRLSFSHTDEQRTDFVDDRIIQDPSDIWDARIGWVAPKGNWDVALWGKNLTDESYIAHMYVIGPGGIGVWGAPRTVGLSVNVYINLMMSAEKYTWKGRNLAPFFVRRSGDGVGE